MTKEEAKLTLQESFVLLSFEYPGRISEAIKTAIEVLSQPSLPSDLDEAAKEYLDKVFGKGENHHFNINLFKAGAEWMARQGISFEDKVYPTTDWEGNIDGYCIDGTEEVDLMSEAVPKGFFQVGDKVIVQIRKK